MKEKEEERRGEEQRGEERRGMKTKEEEEEREHNTSIIIYLTFLSPCRHDLLSDLSTCPEKGQHTQTHTHKSTRNKYTPHPHVHLLHSELHHVTSSFTVTIKKNNLYSEHILLSPSSRPTLAYFACVDINVW